MAEVVINDLQLDGVPESAPGTGKHTVQELMPELRQRRLDGLPHLREQVFFLRGIGSCQDEHVGFFGPLLGSLPARIPQIAQGRGARIVLRSKTPELVKQEFYGLLSPAPNAAANYPNPLLQLYSDY